MSNIRKENVATQKKPVRLFDLLQNHKPIWVRNNTHKVSKKRVSGTMRISLGKDIPPLVVLSGNDPICLSDQAPYDLLRSSPDLITMVNKGLLELLDPTDAEEYYSQNEERRILVQQKLAEYQNKLQIDDHDSARISYESKPSIKDKKVEFVKDAKNQFSDIIPATKIDTSATVQIHSRVTHCYHQLKASNMHPQVALENLLEVEGALSSNDFNFVLNNFSDEPIRNWAKKNMGK